MDDLGGDFFVDSRDLDFRFDGAVVLWYCVVFNVDSICFCVFHRTKLENDHQSQSITNIIPL